MAKPPINPETLHSLEMEMSALGSMFYGEKAVEVERGVAGLQGPIGPAVRGAQDDPALADGPASVGIQELHIHQAADGGRRLYGPTHAAVG